MKVLLLGGTGAMGRYLVEILLSLGFEVFITSRKKHYNERNLTYFQGDAHDALFLDLVISSNSYDVIVDFMVYTTEEFRQKCRLLLEHCNQYIFLSSSRVYSGVTTKIRESTPRILDTCQNEKYLMTDEYALSKAREEDILRTSNFLNWTIVRPYITYGTERLQLGILEKDYWIYQALKNRTIVFSKDIAEKITTLTFGYDVARGIASLMGKKDTYGETFHITSLESYKWSEIFDLYLRILEEELGHKIKYKIVEKSPNLKYKRDKWQVIYDRLYDRQFDANKISNYIDVQSFMPTLKGLEMCLRDFLGNPTWGNLDWREFAKNDRISGEWTPLSEFSTWKIKIRYILARTLVPYIINL